MVKGGYWLLPPGVYGLVTGGYWWLRVVMGW